MNRLDRLREFNVLNYLYACNTPRQMLRLLSEDDEVQAEIRCCAITPDAINELFDNIINAGKTEPKTAFRTEFEMCVIVASYIISKVDARRLNAVADELAEALAKSRVARRFLAHLFREIPGRSQVVAAAQLIVHVPGQRTSGTEVFGRALVAGPRLTPEVLPVRRASTENTAALTPTHSAADTDKAETTTIVTIGGKDPNET